MPLKKCSKSGASGWKWGDQGHCYTGPDAKKKAIKQGLAIDPEEFASTASEEDIAELDIVEKMQVNILKKKNNA